LQIEERVGDPLVLRSSVMMSVASDRPLTVAALPGLSVWPARVHQCSDKIIRITYAESVTCRHVELLLLPQAGCET
jgi:hypothetical protein